MPFSSSFSSHYFFFFFRLKSSSVWQHYQHRRQCGGAGEAVSINIHKVVREEDGAVAVFKLCVFNSRQTIVKKE